MIDAFFNGWCFFWNLFAWIVGFGIPALVVSTLISMRK